MRKDADFLRELELLETFQQLGLVASGELPDDKVAVAKIAAPESRSTTARPIVQAARMAAAPIAIDPQRAVSVATMDWSKLKAAATNCDTCGLCKQRKQAVFGVGANLAQWLFVGESPGDDEDQQGEPFVGQAGKLFDAMLKAAGLSRGIDVYIANVVKCRPPGDRTPTANEATACAPFLDRQIDLLQPKLIVALGKTAVIRLTGSDANMASMRSVVHSYRDIPLIAMYHPAYLLRSPTEKLKAWEDMLFAKGEMAKLTAKA